MFLCKIFCVMVLFMDFVVFEINVFKLLIFVFVYAFVVMSSFALTKIFFIRVVILDFCVLLYKCFFCDNCVCVILFCVVCMMKVF